MTVWSMSVHQCGFSVLCVGVFDIPGDLPILPEGDGDTEAGQQQVGHHTDDRQRCHGDENQQWQAESRRRLLRFFPVDKL